MIGIGAMIASLSGNKETVEAVTKSIGKEIASLKINPDKGDGGALEMGFTDGSVLSLFDTAQSCCESRSMSCDDDLKKFVGATFTGAELRDGGVTTGEYDSESEILFLDVETSKGVLQLVNHNEHNGYYGGFSIAAEVTEPLT